MSWIKIGMLRMPFFHCELEASFSSNLERGWLNWNWRTEGLEGAKNVYILAYVSMHCPFMHWMNVIDDSEWVVETDWKEDRYEGIGQPVGWKGYWIWSDVGYGRKFVENWISHKWTRVSVPVRACMEVWKNLTDLISSLPGPGYWLDRVSRWRTWWCSVQDVHRHAQLSAVILG